MPVTFRAFLDERRKRNDGTYPLKIRITKDGVSKEIGLNVSLMKKVYPVSMTIKGTKYYCNCKGKLKQSGFKG